MIARAYLPDHAVLACGADATYYDADLDPCLVNVNTPTPGLWEAAEHEARTTGRLKWGVRVADDTYTRMYEEALATPWTE